MKRVIVDQYGGPEVLKVVEEDDPPARPWRGAGQGSRRGGVVHRCPAARGTYIAESGAVDVPEDLDPGEVLSLLFPYMTSYQVLHRTAKAKRGETVLVHGAAGRVGIAALELGALAGLRLYGTCLARDRAKVEALGAVAIDYRHEDFLARVRDLTDGVGVDVVVDGLGGPISLRSLRALRPGGRLVVFGRYSTLSDGHKDWPAVFRRWTAIVTTWVWAKLSPRRAVFPSHVQKWRERAAMRPGSVGGEPMDADDFREDFNTMVELLREGKIHPVVAVRLPLSEARHAHELLETRPRRVSSSSSLEPLRSIVDGA